MFANIIALTKGKFIFSFSNIFFFQSKNFIFIINYLKWLLGKTLNIRTFGIYKNFGVSKIFNVNPSFIDLKKSKEFIKNFYKKKITRKIILNIKLNRILLGDILYDSYLRQNNLETITLKKPNQVYFELYKEARNKAKLAKKSAIIAYLEAKNIKKTYMIENINDSDSDFDAEIDDVSESELDGL